MTVEKFMLDAGNGKFLVRDAGFAVHENCCCVDYSCNDCNIRCPHDPDTNQPEPVIVTVAGACGDPDDYCAGVAGEYDFLSYDWRSGTSQTYCVWTWKHETPYPKYLRLDCPTEYHPAEWEIEIYNALNGKTLFYKRGLELTCRDGKLFGSCVLNGYDWYSCDGCTATVTIPEDIR